MERLRRHPLARALRVDKLTLAALQATVAGPETPTWQALRADVVRLRARTERAAVPLIEAGVDVGVTEAVAVVGAGGAPEVGLPSWALSLPEGYAYRLRTAEPPVVGRVEKGRLLLDLRCVPVGLDKPLREAILAVRETLTT